jgi:membrane-associated phospholipid phosphatase
MNKKLKIIGISFLVLLVFMAFSYIVAKGYFTSFDFNTTVKLQDKLSRRVDGVFSLFSDIGNFEIMTIVLITVLLAFKRLKAFIILPIFIAVNFVELYAKFFIDHLPPPHFLLRTQDVIEFPQFYVRAVNSYPSGHSARTIFLCIVLAFFIHRQKKISKNTKIVCYLALSFFCLVMFISRIYLGEHWTTDVIGGAMLGVSLSIFSLIFI